jgi:hypothetical protein
MLRIARGASFGAQVSWLVGTIPAMNEGERPRT